MICGGGFFLKIPWDSQESHIYVIVICLFDVQTPAATPGQSPGVARIYIYNIYIYISIYLYIFIYQRKFRNLTSDYTESSC